MPISGVRGAITIDTDEKEQVLAATQELLESILHSNNMQAEEIASAFFTVTDDIVSTFPAQAARQMGWNFVQMMCAREHPVPNSLPKCIRVLIHWNTDCKQNEIQHVYLREAFRLRPDLVSAQ